LFSLIARPLHQLTEKGVKFEWTAERQKSFELLKDGLVRAPLLVRPDPSKPFLLDTDYQKVAVAAVLSQLDDKGKEHPIAYASKGLNKVEQRWPAYEGELFALQWGIDKFRQYLDNGLEFTVRTDHKPLATLLNLKEPNKKVAGWIMKLQGYTFKIVYREGKSHLNADGLSRARSLNFPPDWLNE
jgi:hypothetical protein